MVSVASAQQIESRIFLVRRQKVMLSPHLAELYGVPAKRLNEAVKRNRRRFPVDFMFQLSKREYEILKSHFATSSWGGPRRALPYAFTEEGIAMLSAVLNSATAVEVSIEIMRVFVRLRRMLSSYEPLRRKLADLERRLGEHDHQIAGN
ncbi:MAG TPA: ORF6N domain-containing protein [Tepidisphaeraceae bacterium]|nr:ORF6N domain-containing protein [Tepidisphaeraceae bacterium]